MGAVVLAALLAVVTGCQEKRKRPEIGQAEGDALQGRDVSGQSPQQAVGGSAKLYVDSVPPGADVYVVLADQPLEKDEAGNFKSRGKTPLILEIEQRRGAKVTILWNMKEYLAKVQELPAMKDWITRFTAPHPFGQSPLAAQEYFSFDSPGTSVVQSTANEILAVGPVYSLDDYPGNRLCALFIPPGIKPSAFHGLMPAPDTFEIDAGGFALDLLRRGLSQTQAIEAADCLRRCGKYVAVVKDRTNPDKSVMVSSTAQKTDPPVFLTQTRSLGE